MTSSVVACQGLRHWGRPLLCFEGQPGSRLQLLAPHGEGFDPLGEPVHQLAELGKAAIVF